MKNLITSMACMAVLLSLILQFTQNQLVHSRIMSIEREADILCESGEIPDDKEMSDSAKHLAGLTGCRESEVTVGVKEENDRIICTVEAPVGRITVSPFFLEDGNLNEVKYYKAERNFKAGTSGDKK